VVRWSTQLFIDAVHWIPNESRVSEIIRSRLGVVRPCTLKPLLPNSTSHILDLDNRYKQQLHRYFFILAELYQCLLSSLEIAIFQLDLESHRREGDSVAFPRIQFLHPGKPDSISTSLFTAMASFEQTVALATCSDCEPQLVRPLRCLLRT
jgi:hypothetical protein